MQSDGPEHVRVAKDDIRGPVSAAGNAAERAEISASAGVEVGFNPGKNIVQNKKIEFGYVKGYKVVRFEDCQDHIWLVVNGFCVVTVCGVEPELVPGLQRHIMSVQQDQEWIWVLAVGIVAGRNVDGERAAPGSARRFHAKFDPLPRGSSRTAVCGVRAEDAGHQDEKCGSKKGLSHVWKLYPILETAKLCDKPDAYR